MYSRIGELLKLPTKDSIPFVNEGIVEKFNGVDVEQTADYVKLLSESYIDKIIKEHHWDTPKQDEKIPRSRPSEPLASSTIASLYNAPGCVDEGTPEHKKMGSDVGFSYRGLLGELLYAYWLCDGNFVKILY